MNGNRFRLVIAGIIAGCIQVSIIIGILVLPNVTSNFGFMSFFIDSGHKQEYASNESSKSSENGILKKLQAAKSNFSKEIVVYNGITVDDGIKSNEQINDEAVELTDDTTSDREKAKKLYDWIGKNIKYDDNKAETVLDEDENVPEGGAIDAFENKSGICFDKACLYVAMARTVNLKVRLMVGQAYNGKEYVGHAWNQVYLSDEDTWINVDTTFYDGGNYFDSGLFNKHHVEEIAGEW